MRFKIRSNGKYVDVSVTDGGTTIDLGLLDDKECLAPVESLQEAMDEILERLPAAKEQGQ